MKYILISKNSWFGAEFLPISSDSKIVIQRYSCENYTGKTWEILSIFSYDVTHYCCSEYYNCHHASIEFDRLELLRFLPIRVAPLDIYKQFRASYNEEQLYDYLLNSRHTANMSKNSNIILS